MGHTITRTIVAATSTTVLVASLTGAAFASSGATTRTNGGGAPVTPQPGATRSGTTQPGTGIGRGSRGRGKGGPGGGKHGRGGTGGPGGKGGGLIVTAVNGDTITATGHAITETVQVSSTTMYTEAGSAASLSDVTVGSHIQARGTSSGTNSINATAIIIQLPSVRGVVTAVNGDSLTVTRMGPRGGHGPRGAAGTAPGTTGAATSTAPTTTTVLVTSSTTYILGGRPASTSSTSTATSASLSSITVGTRINAEGTLGSNGVLTARRIQIAPARPIAPANGTGTTATPGTTSGS